MNYSDLKTVYKETHDNGDPWGSVMGAFFTVANELSHRGSDMPPEWQYSPAMGDDPREPEDYLFQSCIEATDSDLLRLGNVFHRYTDRLVRAGLDY